MLVTPFGLSIRKGPGTALITPSIMSTKVFAQDMPGSDKWGELTFPITGTTGNMVVLIFGGTWTGDADGISGVTWAGAALTAIVQETFAGAGGALCWAGWIRNAGPDGDLVVTSTTTEYTDIVGWVVSFDVLAASPIGATPTVDTIRNTQEAWSMDLAVVNANSRILGVIGACRGGTGPFTSNWTILNNQHTSGVYGVLANKLPGASGLQTMTGTGRAGFGTDDWGSLGVELLPA